MEPVCSSYRTRWTRSFPRTGGALHARYHYTLRRVGSRGAGIEPPDTARPSSSPSRIVDESTFRRDEAAANRTEVRKRLQAPRAIPACSTCRRRWALKAALGYAGETGVTCSRSTSKRSVAFGEDHRRGAPSCRRPPAGGIAKPADSSGSDAPHRARCPYPRISPRPTASGTGEDGCSRGLELSTVLPLGTAPLCVTQRTGGLSKEARFGLPSWAVANIDDVDLRVAGAEIANGQRRSGTPGSAYRRSLQSKPGARVGMGSAFRVEDYGLGPGRCSLRF